MNFQAGDHVKIPPQEGGDEGEILNINQAEGTALVEGSFGMNVFPLSDIQIATLTSKMELANKAREEFRVANFTGKPFPPDKREEMDRLTAIADDAAAELGKVLVEAAPGPISVRVEGDLVEVVLPRDVLTRLLILHEAGFTDAEHFRMIPGDPVGAKTMKVALELRKIAGPKCWCGKVATHINEATDATPSHPCCPEHAKDGHRPL